MDALNRSSDKFGTISELVRERSDGREGRERVNFAYRTP